MVPLSPQTRLRLAAIFAPSDREVAAALLAGRCANDLPLSVDATPESLERVRFAVLKLSHGDLEQMRRMIELAETDWRDVLVAADFADDVEAHLRWWPDDGAR